DTRNNKRGGRSAVIIEKHPLMVVSSTAAILVAVFVTATTMLEAVQPRVHVPIATETHRIAARQPPSFLISPVPIGSQSFNPPNRGHARVASASLDAPDQRDDLRTIGC